ncbi:hypothetical protein LF1_39960 [Rubripirellula obstinata]|uniref:Uncharacterized protein n=1 Tax=Rubripirellula obstinata TaxID=406547 RepID=A0A5B1CLP0_9BACT|nr:hypothetical protein [Rubripirellula obstinata]KAA1261446.1 hypothetical protein LF1_39960 [Rubripirellula obstinata]
MVAFNSLKRKVQRLEDLHCLKAEAQLRSELLRSLQCEKAKQELAETVCTDDASLLDRLLKHGFTAENLPAISVLPIALVAWGSGYVTDEERIAAMNAIYDSELSGNQAAIQKFQSWLDSRPNPELLVLWAEYLKCRIKNSGRGMQPDHFERMIRLASQVALASGGILGFGAICAGEQTVLDQIRALSQCTSDLSA